MAMPEKKDVERYLPPPPPPPKEVIGEAAEFVGTVLEAPPQIIRDLINTLTQPFTRIAQDVKRGPPK